MSDIGQGVYRYLQSKSSVTTVAQGGYPEALPQDAKLPAYTYEVQGGRPEYHMGGQSTLASATINIACFAMERIDSVSLANRIINVLSGYRGAAGEETIRRCHLENEPHTHDAPIDGSDNRRYVTELSFGIHYLVGVPTLI